MFGVFNAKWTCNELYMRNRPTFYATITLRKYVGRLKTIIFYQLRMLRLGETHQRNGRFLLNLEGSVSFLSCFLMILIYFSILTIDEKS